MGQLVYSVMGEPGTRCGRIKTMRVTLPRLRSFRLQ
jgi:hypothetical protein